MPEYRHPRAIDDDAGPPPARQHIARGERVPLTDGTFETDDVGAVRSLAAAYGLSVADLRVGTDADSDAKGAETATLQETIESGACPWCADYEGEHVGQHASSAHPDAWAEYTEANS